MPELSLLTLNIANPSPERAERQLGWLAVRDEDVLVLTETKDSAGCRLLADAFSVAGYHVSYPKPDHGDYGVMIVSRIQAHPDYFGDRVGYLVSRAAAITLPTASGPIHVIGAYVPSRDASVEKTERKRKWLAACTAALSSRDHSQPAIFLGDLNVLEPRHQPRYRFFAPFEYAFTGSSPMIAASSTPSVPCILRKFSTAGSAAPGMAIATIMSIAPPTWPPSWCPATTSTRPASTDSVTTPRYRCA